MLKVGGWGFHPLFEKGLASGSGVKSDDFQFFALALLTSDFSNNF